MPRMNDLSGRKFGSLTVLKYVGTQGGRAQWRCRCDCGNESAVRGSYLTSGHTISCGCQGSRGRPRYTVENIHNFVDKDAAGCWNWKGHRNWLGYGVIRKDPRPDQKKVLFAHRWSYEAHKGPIPSGLHVMHSCDNPACINPDHLSVGTHVDNMRDMAEKGRARNSYSYRAALARPTATGGGS